MEHCELVLPTSIAVMDCQAKLRMCVARGSERFRLRSSESDLSHEFRA